MTQIDSHPEPSRPRGAAARGDRFVRWLVGSPGMAWSVLVIAGLTCVLALVTIAMSRRVLVSPGQVMDQTRVARVAIQVPDHAATETEKRRARERTPAVLVADQPVIDEVSISLRELPGVLGGKANAEELPAEVRRRFAINDANLAEVRREAGSPMWARRIERLADLLRSTPIVDRDTYQRVARSGAEQLELIAGEQSAQARAGELVETPPADRPGGRFEGEMRVLAMKAGFSGDALDAVTNRLTSEPRPTYKHDRKASAERQDRAAAAVATLSTRIEPGQVLYARGAVLSTQALSEVQAEETAYRLLAPSYQRWSTDAGMATAALLIALGVGGYLGTFAPGIMGRPRKLMALCGLFCGALIVSCGVVLIEPRLMTAALVVPAVFLAAVLVVAYERRTALAVGSLLALATAVTLHQPIEASVLALFGVGLMVWRLREIRQRGVLIRAGFLAGALTAGVTLCIGPMRRPLVGEAIPQMFFEAGTVGVGVLLVGFVVLGLLPTIERAFGVVTALSLIELRDPSHPLLRQLQQRAPGTYSHSMNVATLSETAAQAIGADGLLAYVGSLYHDVGKLNRPEFFVENQAGINRHDKLPPAMSTLMIVGHVADGLQLAQEHNLPRPLRHFIESHHGTTMVEYFFRRAQKQHDDACALAGGAAPARRSVTSAPAEGEYRYPGPKPRTKEAAVVMICDACESTARSVVDATPVKIEQMARTICDRRLADGQFDECELTMRELTTIVTTVTKVLSGIHHQRIAYPEAPPPAATIRPSIRTSMPTGETAANAG